MRVSAIRCALGSIVLGSLLVAGCQSGGASSDEVDAQISKSNLTAGMTKRTIVKGTTTQAEVMEVFGPPDLVTHRDDIQIWTYDKIRYDIESSSGYFTVLIAGVGGGRVRSSSTSTMLIVYFDSSDIVRDYRLSVIKF